MTFAQMWTQLEAAKAEQKPAAFARVTKSDDDSYGYVDQSEYITYDLIGSKFDKADVQIEYRRYSLHTRTNRNGRQLPYQKLFCNEEDFESLWVAYEPLK